MVITLIRRQSFQQSNLIIKIIINNESMMIDLNLVDKPNLSINASQTKLHFLLLSRLHTQDDNMVFTVFKLRQVISILVWEILTVSKWNAQ